MRAVTYQISPLEPLLATTLGGDPNSAITHHYIPGSILRGLLAKCFNDEIADLTGDTRTRSLLFDGTVRYLNAYPTLDGKTRLLPIPASWRTPKIKRTETTKIHDFAVSSQTEQERYRQDEAGEPITFEGVDGFVVPTGTVVSPHVPKRQITIHTLRNRSSGRPDEQEGTVYRYEALAAGQTFSGAILVPDDKAGQQIVEKLADLRVHLGGSNTAGYGLVEFSNVQQCADWQEAPNTPTQAPPDDTYVLTLLSDTILRDQLGCFHTDLAAALCAQWQNWDRKQIECTQSAVQLTAAGGFNRTWGLPLPQSQAIAAGSYFVLKLPFTDAVARLNELCETGIGERAIDGFGRVAVNWQHATRKELEIPSTKEATVQPVERPQLSGLSAQMAQCMATRRRRHALDRQLAIAILRLGNSLTGPLPSKTQLSRVRNIARSALQQRDLERIATLFTPTLQDESSGDQIRNPDAFEKAALDQFRRARVAGTRMNLWITQLLAEPQSVWQHFQGRNERKPLIDSAPEGWMAEEYTIRLLDGMLAQAIEQQQREGA